MSRKRMYYAVTSNGRSLVAASSLTNAVQEVAEHVGRENIEEVRRATDADVERTRRENGFVPKGCLVDKTYSRIFRGVPHCPEEK